MFPSELERLKITQHDLKRVPAPVFELHRLTALDLVDNCLEELPKAISTLVNLVSLNLSQNAFTRLPEALFGSGVRHLDLSHNK